MLKKESLLSDGNSAIRDFYVTDNPERFSKVGKVFLGENGLGNIFIIDLSHY